MSILKFEPFSSVVDASFWHELTRLKLDLYKLDDSAVPIHGRFGTGYQPSMPARFTVDTDAFPTGDDEPYMAPAYHWPAPGQLTNTNTLEQFHKLDFKAQFAQCTDAVWEDITSGRAIDDPSLLNRFLLLTFAQVKKYTYTYWFAFPALTFSDNVTVASEPLPVSDVYSDDDAAAICTQFHDLGGPQVFLLSRPDGKDHPPRLSLLSDWHAVVSDGDVPTVGFGDPGSRSTNPGWNLRNVLVLLAQAFGVSSLDVLCYREAPGKQDISNSIVLQGVTLPPLPDTPHAVGWEKNKRGKTAPRKVDLSGMMDPKRLASTSVDLNLKLMRWRLLPELDLELVQGLKCLLLGSGTLGCNVARTLMAWGVRNITLVDNGKVSFSNPVRQTLFTFEDCLDGGRPKAQAAADRMQLIFPGVNARGLNLSIPMPGHAVAKSSEASVRDAVAQLEQLVKDHDVIYLLMDTRESRWLPTLLGAVHGKLVVTCALGFDNYVVMRHGVDAARVSSTGSSSSSSSSSSSASSSSIQPGPRLGCYYCNDVVAPTDSLSDRSLDQQCTVTRPGLSMMASAVAVELAVALMHHPLRTLAPADTKVQLTTQTQHPLGLLPHQLRGFLTHYTSVFGVCEAFDKCTACSQIVVNEYERRGADFVLDACNDSDFLETISGLKDMKAAMDAMDFEAFDDDDDDVDDF